MEKLQDSLHPTGFDSWSNYIGQSFEDSQLLVLLARHRDSDCLSESNFAVALGALGGESETVQIIRIGHWAVGWIEYLCVLAGSPAEVIAQDIENALSDYPVLDETDLSEREQACANELWSSWPVSWRLEWLRENRDEYRLAFPELLSAARGSFFPGYAPDFIY